VTRKNPTTGKKALFKGYSRCQKKQCNFRGKTFVERQPGGPRPGGKEGAAFEARERNEKTALEEGVRWLNWKKREREWKH